MQTEELSVNVRGRRKYWMKNKDRLNKEKRDILIWAKFYFGNECVKCGAKNCFLDFHHIDPNTKLFDIGKGVHYRNFLKEINKCELLCRSCHVKITWGKNGKRRKKSEKI